MLSRQDIRDLILIVLCIINIILVADINIYTYAKDKEISVNVVEEDLQVTKQNTEIAEVVNLYKITTDRQVSYSSINSYTDLSVMNSVTVNDINKIIDYWNQYIGTGSPFVGNGQIFIDAAKETGLDPVYILAHAGVESAWGTSYYGRNYHNYFGIGAFNHNPDNAINYSNDSMREGIIEGAKWIKRNYYDNGQTTLHSMRYNNGDHEYCTSTTWVTSISDIIQVSYSLI